jgi:hypothetical protein
MTMCTLTQFRGSGNARVVNWWWTGGERAADGEAGGSGVGLVVESAGFPGEAQCRWKSCG